MTGGMQPQPGMPQPGMPQPGMPQPGMPQGMPSASRSKAPLVLAIVAGVFLILEILGLIPVFAHGGGIGLLSLFPGVVAVLLGVVALILFLTKSGQPVGPPPGYAAPQQQPYGYPQQQPGFAPNTGFAQPAPPQAPPGYPPAAGYPQQPQPGYPQAPGNPQQPLG